MCCEDLRAGDTYELYLQGYKKNNSSAWPIANCSGSRPLIWQLGMCACRLVVGMLNVTWNSRSDQAYYHIRWRRDGFGGALLGYDSGIFGTSYAITNVAEGEYYLVSVAANGIDGSAGEFSDPIRVRARSGSTLPSAVSRPDLSDDSGEGRQITVEWTRPSKPSSAFLRKYELRLYQEGTDTTSFHNRNIIPSQQESPPRNNETTLAAPSDDDTYRVAIRAQIDPGGWGEWSPEASITFAPEAGIDAADRRAPNRPGSLTLTIDDADPSNPKMVVAWWKPDTPATNPITFYELHQRSHLDSTGRSYNFSPKNNNAQQSTTITGLRTRVRYYYRLRAKNSTGASSWSPTAQIYLPDSENNLTPQPTSVPTPVGLLPGRPTNPRTTAITDVFDKSYVTFFWDESDSDGNRRITGYMVRYRIAGQTWTEVDNGNVFQFRLGRRDAVNNTRYEFQAAAVNSVGQGSWTSSVYATPLKAPDTPDEATIVAGNGELRVSWQRPEANDRGVSYYMLFYATADNSSYETIERINGTSYTIRNLTNGTEYKVTVSAISSAGQSGWSIFVYGTPN